MSVSDEEEPSRLQEESVNHPQNSSSCSSETEEQEEEDVAGELPRRESRQIARSPLAPTPLDDLLKKTTETSSCPFTADEILSEAEPNALLFWATTVSNEAKALKSKYLRRKRGEDASSVPSLMITSSGREGSSQSIADQFYWSSKQVVVEYMNFHTLSLEKFAVCAALDPKKRFSRLLLKVKEIIDRINRNIVRIIDPEDEESSNTSKTTKTLRKSGGGGGGGGVTVSPNESGDSLNVPTVTSLSSSSSSLSPSASDSSSNTNKSSSSEGISTLLSSEFPYLELCLHWGIASFRFGKALQRQQEKEASFAHLEISCDLFSRILTEPQPPLPMLHTVLTKMPEILEKMAEVNSGSFAIRENCDLFLVQYSNIAMRGTIQELNLRPLLALVLSENRHIRECKPIEVVRHLASYFDSKIAKEAREQLQYLESILQKTKEKESRLEALLTPDARKRLAESGLTKEEIYNNTEVVISLMQWSSPPCRCPSDPITKDKDDTRELVWITEKNPSKLFSDRYKLSDYPSGSVYLAKRKSDGLPVAIKVLRHFEKNQENIRNEINLMFSFNHENLAQLLDVYHWLDKKRNEVWLVMEYCDAGNLVDIIPVAVLKESQIAYICREVLKALHYLHSNNRMHRDLTCDDILLNCSGDVMVADFEIWITGRRERYWLAPELLQSSEFPFGPEADIWSFGCIVMEMADGFPPFSDVPALKEFFHIATKGAPSLSKPHKWSSEFKDFLAEAMHSDPKRRGSAAELLKHPFISKSCTREKFGETIQLRVSWARW